MTTLKHIPGLLAALILCGCYGSDPQWQRLGPQGTGTIYDLCRGDNDGLIERDEIVYVEGAQVACRVNAPGSVVVIDTTPPWDFSGLGVADFAMTYSALKGAWFEESFPGADWWTPLDHLSGLDAVYGLEEDRMDFYGAASLEPGRVLLPYDPPVAVLRFPLGMGDGWTVETGVRNGVMDGVPISSEETYSFEVAQKSDLTMDGLRFQNTLLLKVRLSQRFPGGVTAEKLQYIWVHECYGELARASAAEFVDGDPVIRATEFRRLLIQP
jgi:hypothetical protein